MLPDRLSSDFDQICNQLFIVYDQDVFNPYRGGELFYFLFLGQ